MQRMVIDCSVPKGHPDKQKTEFISADEIQRIQGSWAASDSPPPSEIQIRLSALEAKVGVTEKDRQEALASILIAQEVADGKGR